MCRSDLTGRHCLCCGVCTLGGIWDHFERPPGSSVFMGRPSTPLLHSLCCCCCEILQVSSNVILGRSHIGIHYRMDGVNGALVGETSSVRRLQQVQYVGKDHVVQHARTRLQVYNYAELSCAPKQLFDVCCFSSFCRSRCTRYEVYTLYSRSPP